MVGAFDKNKNKRFRLICSGVDEPRTLQNVQFANSSLVWIDKKAFVFLSVHVCNLITERDLEMVPPNPLIMGLPGQIMLFVF